MSIKVFLLYLAAWSLTSLSPGPAVMCSMAQSTRYGFRSSLAGISGIQAGSVAFFVSIALGLGTLLATAEAAFMVLRVVGGIYLFYLGVRIIIASFRRAEVRASQPGVAVAAHRSDLAEGNEVNAERHELHELARRGTTAKSTKSQNRGNGSVAAHRSLFIQGLLIQLTNPKALLFVSALLPQFIEPHRSVGLQLLILLLATVAVDTVVLSSYAYFAQRGIQSFRGSRLSRWLERVFGGALVFFGLRLVVSRKG